MIVAGVWTGAGFSNLKNCLIRIQKFWNRSGVGDWKSDCGNLWYIVPCLAPGALGMLAPVPILKRCDTGTNFSIVTGANLKKQWHWCRSKNLHRCQFWKRVGKRMRQKKNKWFYIGGSGLDRTDDFQKFCGSGLDRIQIYWIRTGLGLKNFTVRSYLISPSKNHPVRNYSIYSCYKRNLFKNPKSCLIIPIFEYICLKLGERRTHTFLSCFRRFRTLRCWFTVVQIQLFRRRSFTDHLRRNRFARQLVVCGIYFQNDEEMCRLFLETWNFRKFPSTANIQPKCCCRTTQHHLWWPPMKYPV